jgi:hypothetical protein
VTFASILPFMAVALRRVKGAVLSAPDGVGHSLNTSEGCLLAIPSHVPTYGT